MSDTYVRTESAPRIRASRRGRPLETFAAAGLGLVLVALAADVRVWWAPFIVGAALGMLPVRARVGGLSAVASSLFGWTALLGWRALSGEPVIATARVAAALAGLPPDGWIIVVATLLVAAIQGLLGLWLVRSLRPLFGRSHRNRVDGA